MRTEEIYQQFEQILSDLRGIEGLPEDSVVQVAQAILHEAGKDRRTELLRDVKSCNNGGNGNSMNINPATPKQVIALRNFGIRVENDITKAEAYKLLEEAFNKLHNRV